MPSKSKTKGKAFENDMAKFLTEVYGENFKRAFDSGAFVGMSNAFRKQCMTEGQLRSHKGDITGPDSFNHWNCECKN